MAELITTANVSVDGYINDEHGSIGWTAPSADVFSFVTDLERPIGTYLYGRRLYETMVYWETHTSQPEDLPRTPDYTALWQAADKVVYSATLATVSSARTRIERTFDPDTVRTMKEESGHDLSIGGPTLAVHAFRAGLIDEVRLFVHPISIGSGTPFLPAGQRVDLQLREEHRFASGVVFLRYRVS